MAYLLSVLGHHPIFTITLFCNGIIIGIIYNLQQSSQKLSIDDLATELNNRVEENVYKTQTTIL
jgi:hypothetical protein